MSRKRSRSSLHPRPKESVKGAGNEHADSFAEIRDEIERTPDEPISLEVNDVLDLHSFAPKDVITVVEAYLEEARARGFSTVRIIHGKGTGTQRAQIQALLKRTSFVESFQDAPLEAGSWGATVVWFRDEGH